MKQLSGSEGEKVFAAEEIEILGAKILFSSRRPRITVSSDSTIYRRFNDSRNLNRNLKKKKKKK